jgi:hypothetical protein
MDPRRIDGATARRESVGRVTQKRRGMPAYPDAQRTKDKGQRTKDKRRQHKPRSRLGRERSLAAGTRSSRALEDVTVGK